MYFKGVWVNGRLTLWPKDWTNNTITPCVNLPLIGNYWWMSVWLRITCRVGGYWVCSIKSEVSLVRLFVKMIPPFHIWLYPYRAFSATLILFQSNQSKALFNLTVTLWIQIVPLGTQLMVQETPSHLHIHPWSCNGTRDIWSFNSLQKFVVVPWQSAQCEWCTTLMSCIIGPMYWRISFAELMHCNGNNFVFFVLLRKHPSEVSVNVIFFLWNLNENRLDRINSVSTKDTFLKCQQMSHISRKIKVNFKVDEL